MHELNPSTVTAADLNDPTIDAENLRRIAIVRPDLRQVILQHPNCHAELDDYIGQLQGTDYPTAPNAGQPYPYPGGQAGGYHHPNRQFEGYASGYGAYPAVTPSDEKTWGILMHIGSIFFGFLVPLVVWLIYRDRSATLDQQGRAALNWQISYFIYATASWILMFALVGFVTIFVVIILDLIFCIIAAVKASDREPWKYPLSIPFLQVNI